MVGNKGHLEQSKFKYIQTINKELTNKETRKQFETLLRCLFKKKQNWLNVSNILTDEILQLLKAYCYPSLYYASNVWLTPSLNAKLKSNLFSSSGKILSTIEVNSYKNLHKKFTRATPEMWLKYELAISLYDLNITKLPLSDWQLLQINTLQNRRSTKLHFTAPTNYDVAWTFYQIDSRQLQTG